MNDSHNSEISAIVYRAVSYLEIHPLTQNMPMLAPDAAEFLALVQSIKAHGIPTLAPSSCRFSNLHVATPPTSHLVHEMAPGSTQYRRLAAQLMEGQLKSDRGSSYQVELPESKTHFCPVTLSSYQPSEPEDIILGARSIS